MWKIIAVGICLSFAAAAAAAERFETLAVVRELEEIQVPARRDGVIEELLVRRGMQVKNGELIGRQNTNDVLLKLAVAKAEKNQVTAKSKNRAPIESAATVVKRNQVESKLLGELGEHAVYLEQYRMENSLEKALADLKAAENQLYQDQLQVEVKGAEMAVLENDIKQMQVQSPVTGVVREVLKHQGEWVRQGEAIVALTRMDKILVEGFLDSKHISPHAVSGAKTTVRVTLSKQEVVEIEGLVVDQTAPKLELDGKFPVWVLIDNRQTKDAAGSDRWLIRPGMTGSMTIEVQ